MADATRVKAGNLIQSLDRRYGKVELPVPVPPPSSADAAAVASASAKNQQIIAGVVLGLHGPPAEGADAAKKLMTHFVDWNEVRVSRPATLIAALGRNARGPQRIQILQRFLEAYFLRQRSLNLDYLFTLKQHEVKRFLSELEVFERDELAAVFLTGFGIPLFPPDETLCEIAERVGLVKPKTTALQLAKKFETACDEKTLYSLYSHLYSMVGDNEALKQYGKKGKKAKK